MTRQNNFDALRLLAAALVIFGHAFPLTGAASPGFLGNSVQTIGVKVFFVISGYLITQSWLSDPDLIRYTARRLLRIMPGLAMVVLVCAALVGPAVSTLPVGDYFSNGGFARYFSNIGLYIRYDLPGVFNDNRYPGAVNGSLWSLPVEMAMYVVMPLLLLLRHDSRVGRWLMPLVALLLSAAALQWVRAEPPVPPPVVYGMNLVSALDAAPYFLLGSCFAVLRLERWCNLQVSLVLLAMVTFSGASYVASEALLMLVLPYSVLSFGMAPAAVFAGAGRHGDFSYGLYLYGFPAQQFLMHVCGNQLTAWQNFALALPLALLMAVLSWHLVEKTMLRWKPYTPARRADLILERP